MYDLVVQTGSIASTPKLMAVHTASQGTDFVKGTIPETDIALYSKGNHSE